MEFFVGITFFLTIINFVVLVCCLRTSDNNTDLILDLHREFRKFRRLKKK